MEEVEFTWEGDTFVPEVLGDTIGCGRCAFLWVYEDQDGNDPCHKSEEVRHCLAEPRIMWVKK